ncbi:MAG TPA: YjfI family protein [Allosphingosinicella sp.]|jgi:hypothetical protein
MRARPCRVKRVCYVGGKAGAAEHGEDALTESAPQQWTATSLCEAIQNCDARDEIAVSSPDGADGVIVATMRQHGDLTIYMSVSGEQIVVSTLLWPVDEQENEAEFNRFILKAQKVVPLSNFAITEADGRDYYELIGELSADSNIATILLELRVLAENAISAASELREAFASA